MVPCGTRVDACEALDTDLAESIVLQAYVQLLLLPRQPDGSWVAPLKRFAHCDLRLVEIVPATSDQAVLRVELFDRHSQAAREGAGLRRGGGRRRRISGDDTSCAILCGFRERIERKSASAAPRS
jgi:hypothetical protein